MNLFSTSHRSSSSHRFGSGNTSSNVETIQQRVMKSVLEYNRQLNQERQEDRRVCMDLQTYTIQYPVGLGRENRELRRWIRRRKKISPLWRHGRRYPVALLPNQYQDWFLSYSPHELKYFPLNTVLHGPAANDYDNDIKPSTIHHHPVLQSVSNNNSNPNNPLMMVQSSDQMNNNSNLNTNSDSDLDGSDVLSDLDDDSTCSCGEIHCSTSSPKTKIVNNNENFDPHFNSQSQSNFGQSINDENSYPSGTEAPNFSNSFLNNDISLKNNINGSTSENALCKVCNQIIDPSLSSSASAPLICADCGSHSHPACLEISGELLEAIRLYRWQCQDCKSCQQCGQPHDEEKMMFCDKCDRGYHTYCVGLVDIPQGHWVCSLCAICANCGAKKPSSTLINSSTQQSNDNSNNQELKSGHWQHELIKILSPDGQTLTRHTILCETCHQLRKLP